MRRMNLGMTVFLAGATLAPVFAQGSELFGLGGDTAPAAVEAAVAPEVVVVDETERVLAKLNAGKELLTVPEFLTYIRALEALPRNQDVIAAAQAATQDAELPARGWALISSKLHDMHYGSMAQNFNDRGVVYSVGPTEDLSFEVLRLFRDGTENQDFQKIDLLHPRGPKYILDAEGQKLDIAHSYAAVAALVMRDQVSGTLMGNVNTGWGDSLQVVGGKLKSRWPMVKGIFGLDARQIQEADTQWEQADQSKSDDQVRGNVLGNEARSFLMWHRRASLSEAFEVAFARVASQS